MEESRVLQQRPGQAEYFPPPDESFLGQDYSREEVVQQGVHHEAGIYI